ncbi:MAG: hypothetical protein DYG98_17525 [Haliscomenobacteraceae bacterium CHB4]|nr:hypothetical protein [Haliscomenobacteraceae bacterium CHB4]
MRSDLLKNPLPETRQRLIIPDSLKNTYRYTGKLKDYEHDYATILQFSSLLPTKEPNIYLMEFYTWGNTCHETGCVRLLNRFFLKFKIENQKVISLDGVLLKGQADFIGFGNFSRTKRFNSWHKLNLPANAWRPRCIIFQLLRYLFIWYASLHLNYHLYLLFVTYFLFPFYF